MSNKNLTIGLLITLVIAVCGFFFPQIHSAVKSLGGVQSTTDVGTTNFTSISVSAGEANGGLWTTSTRINMTQASKTLCSIASPNASSTLTMAGVNMTTSASYATTYMLGLGTTAVATTTSLVASISAAANGPLSFIATSTAIVDGVIAPNTFVNFNVSTSTVSATYAPVGTCTAEFQVL